ncbi:MAG TPA: CapA family protein [Vicinamibacterales bacterium]|nr:CapA family protein [Vicinamibacterales bacterium]
MTRAVLLGIVAGAAGLSAQPAPSITITLTGQSMIRSDLRSTAPAAVPAIRALLHGDVVFTNFEGAVAEPGETVREGRGFLAPPGALDALASFGFNLLSLSNNHAFDLKERGIENTIREADARHLAHAGTGRDISEASAPAYFRTPGGTVALVSSASGLIASGAAAGPGHAGVNELRVAAGGVPNEATTDLPGAAANAPDAGDAQRILRSIREARAHADVVVVYQHNHVFGNRSFSTIFTEGLPERLVPNAWLRAWTHAEIDAGADIVVMHGAPLLHGVEIYRGRPIFYDLGNFIYNVPPTLTYIDEPMAWESAIADVRIQGRRLASISLRPIVLNPIGSGQPDVHDPYADNEFLHTRGLPSAATGARARYILQRIADASKKFGTTFSVSDQTATIALRSPQ